MTLSELPQVPILSYKVNTCRPGGIIAVVDLDFGLVNLFPGDQYGDLPLEVPAKLISERFEVLSGQSPLHIHQQP